MDKRRFFMSILPPMGLAAIFVLLVALVSPFYEAALDDSWNFALPTKHFLETGVPVFDPFNSAAAVLHIVWGGLFCKIIGFSFSACRLSNIAMALISTLALYWAFRQRPFDRATSFFAAAAFAVNPVLMVTAYTYQSDIVYLALTFFSTGFYLRYLRTLRHTDLLAASIIVGLSIWNKMHGSLLAGGAFVFFALTHRKNAIRGLRWLTISAVPAVFIVGFRLAKPIIHPVSTTLDGKMVEFTDRLFSPSVWLFDGSQRFLLMIAACGLYALPLFCGWLFARKDEPGVSMPVRIGVGLFWLVAVAGGLASLGGGHDGTYPFHSSVFRELPPLPDNFAFHVATKLAWPLGALLGAHLTLASLDAIRNRGRTLLLLGLLVPQMLLLVPILLFMDRYFLVLFPLMFLILAERFDGRRFRWVLATPVLIAFFLLGATRIVHYRNSNVAQWEAAQWLMDQGAPSLEIDGGYAWTGWHNYEHSLAHPDIDRSRPGDNWYIGELDRSTDVQYVVSFFPPPPQDTLIRTFDYDYWFANEPGKVYVSKRPYAVWPPK